MDAQTPAEATKTSMPSNSCARSTSPPTANIPDVTMIAEESTAWPMVSRPTDVGRAGLRPEMEHGLDARHARNTFPQDPIYRRYHHGQLTFSLLYAFNENFVLPLSHDEVVHGKALAAGEDAGR